MRVESPSSLSVFKECPRRYQATYIDHEITFKPNRYTERGNQIHDFMDRTIKGEAVTWPTNELATKRVADEYFSLFDVANRRAAGWVIATERSLAINREARPVNYDSPAAYLRCRVDLFMASPERDRLFIVDWKTGKTPGTKTQLVINAMCLAPMFEHPLFHCLFVYLDQDSAVMEDIDISQPGTTEHVYDLMNSIERAYTNNFFPANHGASGCRWCELRTKC
jgi:hypothetical protein